MTDPLRIILVGVARRGRAWVEAFTATPEWQPVALVDVDLGFLELARQTAGLARDACFRSLSDALAAVDADAVSIVVPARLHAEMIGQALAAGRHILVEKPFTNSLRDAERLVALAEQQDRAILVTQTARYSRVSRTLQRLVAEEVYGPLGFLTLIHHKARAEPYPYSDHAHLWSQGVHELDAMCCVAGRPVQRVIGRSIQPSWCSWPSEAMAEALITFGPRRDQAGSADPIYGTYVGTSAARAPGYSFRLECADAALLAGRGNGTIQALSGDTVHNVPLDELPYDNTDHHLARLFHRAIRLGEEAETSGRRNLETMRLLDAIVESGKSGHTVEIS